MDAFNLIKEVSELLYYWVGIAGLITIYITVKNNIQNQKEKNELKEKNAILEKQNRANIIREFKITIYSEFQKWMEKNGNQLQPKGYDPTKFIKDKKLTCDEKNHKDILDLMSDDDHNKMKYFIEKLDLLAKTYCLIRDSEKDEELDDYFCQIFNSCIIECEKINLVESFPDVFKCFKEITRDRVNSENEK